MLELSQLGCFVAAAEELHFGHAATRLNMTQPSLSRQIQALERALSVQLFERSNRTVHLTSAGRIFLPEAKRILTMTESAANWTRRTWRGEAGIIRLGFTATAAFSDIPAILDRAAIDLPDVKITLHEGTSATQRNALFADTLDVALLRPPIDQSRFSAMAVRCESFVAALHAGDPLAAKTTLALADFHERNFIMHSPESAGYGYNILTDLFERAGVTPRTIHHLEHNHAILSLVSAGLGSAMVPRSLTRLHLSNVVFRDVATDPVEPIKTYMLWRPENRNPILPCFLSLCRSVFALNDEAEPTPLHALA